MKNPFAQLFVLCLLCIATFSYASVPDTNDEPEKQTIQSYENTGWIQLFNGKDLNGWKHQWAYDC